MRKSVSFLLLFTFTLSGCSLRAPMKRFSTQEDVGTVHVAVQSIAKFDDAYTDQLQPSFQLSSTDALNAISQTQISEAERLRSLAVELALSGRKKTVTSERTTENGVVTDKLTEKSETGDPSELKGPEVTGLTNNAPGITTVDGKSTSGSVVLDQSLRYRAAAALMQEIALFNRYVRDAAVTRDAIPYVVRLLVTVNPSARREPYDVYTTISFFANGEPDYSTEESAVEAFNLYMADSDKIDIANDAYKSTQDRLKLRQKNLTENYFKALKIPVSPEGSADRRYDAPTICDRAVEIIPLFVTDNLESSLNSVANERVIDGSGAATGWFANITAALGISGKAVDRERSLARSVNGLTTISRMGVNTILARLGASQVNNQYEMVARTYNVTLLALVPSRGRLEGTSEEPKASDFDDYLNRATTPCRQFSFTAHSSFRDAVHGTELPTVYKNLRARLVTDVIDSWDFDATDPQTVPVVTSLLSLAQLGRYEQFRNQLAVNMAVLKGPLPLADVTFQNTLWHDLIAQNDRSGRSYGDFQLPESTTDFFGKTEKVTLYDDEKSTTVVLNGARNLNSDGLHASIVAKEGAEEVRLDETAVRISDDRRRATFTFPSLSSRLATNDKYDSIEFVASKIDSGTRGTKPTTWKATDSLAGYRLIKKTPDPVLTELTISSGAIRMATAGTGDIAVALTAKKPEAAPSVLLIVEGATIVGVAPVSPFVGGALEVVGHGNYVISLKNLFADTPVKIKAVLASDGSLVGEKMLVARP